MSTRTTLHFDHLAGYVTPDPVVVERELDAFDIVDYVRGVVAVARPGAHVEIEVDLVTGGRDGRFWILFGRRPVGEGSVTIADVDDTPPAVVVTYPDGQTVLQGDVVRVGATGTAIHVVVAVALDVDQIWLREAGGRERQSTQPVGRLHLLERASG